MDGARLALIVANDAYDDPELGRLEAPAHDAEALAAVLSDPGIGSFDVRVEHNRAAQDIRVAVEEFFADRSPDDLLLLHFSCHGVKNADGELFLALRDTRPKVLAATGLAADFVNRQMAASRAQRIALFLDCCYGGAFPRGMLVRASSAAQVKDAFADQEDLVEGRGRVVVTASNAMQYSFEGGKLGEHRETPSVFTGALVDALTTGEADRDGDGWIGMNELFGYLKTKVPHLSPNQTPQMWTFGATGDIRVARSRLRRITAAPLEAAVVEALADELPAVRYGLVDLLRDRLASDDLGRALAAWNQLVRLQEDDSNKVSDAADAAVASAALHVTPDSLDLQLDDSGAASGELACSGPPLALAFTATADVPWLKVEYADPRLRVVGSDPGDPEASGTVTLTSPTGVCRVPVRVRRRVRGATEDDAHVGPRVGAPPVADEPEPEPAATVEDPPPPGPGRPWRRWLPWAAAAVAAGVVVAVPFSLDRGGGAAQHDGGGGSLPQSAALADDVLVWTDQSGTADWPLEVGAAGGPVTKLPHPAGFSAEWPVVLPDRRTVLYQAVRGDPSGRGDATLRVAGSDGSGDRELFSRSDACPSPGRPSVSPDGTRIALVCFDQNAEPSGGVKILDLEGNVLRTLDRTAVAWTPTWSQDGGTIVYAAENEATVNGEPGRSLWAVPADGSVAPKRLTTDPSHDSLPAISPDENWIVYVRETDGRRDGDLFLSRIRTNDAGDPTFGKPRRLQASVDGASNDPTWSPDSSAIVYSSRGVLMKVAADVQAPAEPLFDRSQQHAFKAVWARR